MLRLRRCARRFSARRMRSPFLSASAWPARADAEGRVYPASNMAAGVLDALRLGAAEAGARKLICDFEVREITPVRDGFRIAAADGRSGYAAQLLLACGGLAAPKLGAGSDGYRLLQGALGIRFAPRYPAHRADSRGAGGGARTQGHTRARRNIAHRGRQVRAHRGGRNAL